MQPVNLIAAHNYEHRSNRTQCPLSTRVLTGSSRAWMRNSIACTEPTSSGIIKLGTYVIFELIIREAVEQAVMCFGSNRRFKALRVVSVVPPSAARIEMGAPTRLPSSQGTPKINSDFQK